MKKQIVLIAIYMVFVQNYAFSQTLKETKLFIKEKVEASSPLPGARNNYVFFNDNILKPDADRLAGKTLSAIELENIFIYAQEYLFNGGVIGTRSETIDIRDIKKISLTKINSSNGDIVYSIKVSIGNNYNKSHYYTFSTSQPEYRNLEIMNICIGDNSELAKKIKKAIIHLAKLKNIDIVDSDELF